MWPSGLRLYTAQQISNMTYRSIKSRVFLKLFRLGIALPVLLMMANDSYGQSGIVQGDDRYLGEPLPSTEARVFARSHFPDWTHNTPVFSPDFAEMYWSKNDELMRSRFENGEWSQSIPMLLSDTQFLIADPFMSPDGNRLFFLVRSPNIQGLADAKENIWYIDRVGDSWSEPSPVGINVNEHQTHWQLSVASNGNLYFMVREDDKDDIFMSAYVDGVYQKAVRLSAAVNSAIEYEMTPYVAPDESYLLFARSPDNTQSMYQLYKSKNINGEWQEAERLPVFRDASRSAISPIVSHDGRFLFFMAWLGQNEHRAHWMSISDLLD